MERRHSSFDDVSAIFLELPEDSGELSFQTLSDNDDNSKEVDSHEKEEWKFADPLYP